MAEEQTISEEQIAANYAAMLHSVDLINGSKPSWMSNDAWNDIVETNKEDIFEQWLKKIIGLMKI